ncbi:hypothetical protein RCL1_004011 [Eukaryota sp. TZLM3-RCL]
MMTEQVPSTVSKAKRKTAIDHLFDRCSPDVLLSNCFSVTIRELPIHIYSVYFGNVGTLGRLNAVKNLFSSRLDSDQVDLIILDEFFIYSLLLLPEKTTQNDVLKVNFLRSFSLGQLPTEFEPSSKLKGLLKSLLSAAICLTDLGEFENVYYHRDAFRELVAGLSVLPGYSLRLFQASSAWFLEIGLHNKIVATRSVLDEYNNSLQKSKLKLKKFQKEFTLEFIHVHYFTNTCGAILKFDGIDFSKTPDSVTLSNGQTLFEYFFNTFGINLNRNQPLAFIRNGELHDNYDYFPLEVISRTERFAPNQVEKLSQASQLHPFEMHLRFATFFKAFNTPSRDNSMSAVEFLSKWGIDLSLSVVNSITSVPITRLSPLCLDFGIEKLKGNYKQGNASFLPQFRDYPVRRPVPLDSLLFIYHQTAEVASKKILDSIIKKLDTLAHISIRPKVIQVKSGKTFAEVFKIYLEQRDCPQFVIACVPDSSFYNRDDFKLFSTSCSILSEYIDISSVGRNLSSTANNIVHKIQIQLGAVPWTVPLPQKIFSNGSPVLVAGIDISVVNSQYFYAIVTMLFYNDEVYFFSAFKELQTPVVTEFHNDTICHLVTSSLSYYNSKGLIPKTVIVYRNEHSSLKGLTNEVDSVKIAVQQCIPDSSLLYTTVNDHSETLLFSLHGEKRRNTTGTVISEIIVDRSEFIMSAAPRDDIFKPVRFDILANEIPFETGFTTFDFYSLTFSLCHLYFGSHAAIEVPAVCKYASNLANLFSKFSSRYHDLKEVPNQLVNKVFFV